MPSSLGVCHKPFDLTSRERAMGQVFEYENPVDFLRSLHGTCSEKKNTFSGELVLSY